MIEYFSTLFFDGEFLAECRNCLDGWLFDRTSRSLLGWTCRSRSGVVGPVTFGVIAHTALHFAMQGQVRLALHAPLGSDTCLRPSELLGLSAANILPPARAAGPQFARVVSIVEAPAVEEAETKTGFKVVTIVVGDARPKLVPVISKFCRLKKRDKLFPFDLSRMESEFSFAIKAVGFPLRFTPDVLRHSGPSCHRYEQRRSLEDIRRRGQWASPRSVAGYERHAALLRSLHKLRVGQQGTCCIAELNVVNEMLPFITAVSLFRDRCLSAVDN